MKSISLWFTFFGLLINDRITCSEAAVMPNSYYELDGSTDSECTLRDLNTERNLNIDFPMSKEPPKCRLTWSELNQRLREDMSEFIKSYMPGNDNCVSKELVKREKTLDLIMTISAIQAADFFSESEKSARLINYRNEMKTDLIQIAAGCQASEEKLISLFKSTFENNEMLIANETNYCRAKYVQDKGILSLTDVNLNPGNINIGILNCSIVMAEEIRKDEKRVRENITLRDEAAITCLMNVYKENKIVDLSFAALVLRDLKMPIETKRLEQRKYDLERASRSRDFINCYKMDADFDPVLLKKIEDISTQTLWKTQ